MKINSSIARRQLLKFGAAVIGTTVVAKVTNSGVNAQTKSALHRRKTTVPALTGVPRSKTIIALDKLDENSTPDQVLEELLQGNQRFVENKPEAPNQDYIRLKEVSSAQKPLVSIMSCSDSRVPLGVVFDRGIGDLFVVRDAGNIATPEEIGSLEYGAVVLGTPILMVMGHEKCGAVKAALENKPLPGQIGSIVAAIQPAIDRDNQNDSEEFYTETIKNNVRLQIEKLNGSPLLHDLVEQGQLKIVGAYYSLETGEVSIIS